MKIGVIGFGLRIAMIVDHLLGLERGVKLAAITDIDPVKVEGRLRERGIDPADVALYGDADAMLDAEQLDGVLIGTRCSLHTPMALKVLRRDLPLFLEKPVAINEADLRALREAGLRSSSPVVVSFPLRNTPLFKLVKEIVDSGRIGTVEHVQAVNNVPYGGVYFHDWYRDEKETGGLFLQKATHDFDYITHLLGLRPVSVCAMKSKRIFKGDKPAGLRCVDCGEYHTCPESPYVLERFKAEQAHGEMCSFAVDTGNEDSGSAIIQYETGMHASYSHNFFARKAAAVRGSRLLGYDGTVEFDWNTDEAKVYMHATPRVETYKVDASHSSHGGGDAALAINFLGVMQGKEKSGTPLEAGLISALMCLKAKQAAETHAYQEIRW